jgi:hypothetical protein
MGGRQSHVSTSTIAEVIRMTLHHFHMVRAAKSCHRHSRTKRGDVSVTSVFPKMNWVSVREVNPSMGVPANAAAMTQIQYLGHDLDRDIILELPVFKILILPIRSQDTLSLTPTSQGRSTKLDSIGIPRAPGLGICQLRGGSEISDDLHDRHRACVFNPLCAVVAQTNRNP